MFGCTAAVAPPPRVAPAQVNVEPTVPDKAMVFPPVPAVLSVTVTTAPADVAVSAETLVLIALASAAASLAKSFDWVVSSVLVKKVKPEVVPAVPPVRLPLNAGEVSPDPIVVATLMLLPASPVSVAVIFTIPLPPLVAPTPTALVAPIAVMMLVASVAALTLAAADHH
jgi:hypothetical protein